MEFDSRPEFGTFVCERAGLRGVVGGRQSWRVGEHELTVELALDRDRYIYVLFVRGGWPLHPAPRSLCLAEVYAITRTGTIRAFRPPELARLKAMALVDAGLVERPEVRLAALPLDAPDSARRTWEAVEELLVVRSVSGQDPSEPFPFVAPWVASLNGTTEPTIRSGKLWLVRQGFLTHVAYAPGRFGKPTHLWSARLEGGAT